MGLAVASELVRLGADVAICGRRQNRSTKPRAMLRGLRRRAGASRAPATFATTTRSAPTSTRWSNPSDAWTSS
ncbi:MAG: hypothetical protein H6724_17775 [Sandaracinus sp.]|nr:hypothetical protein [Sandaracinus sp.]